MTKKIRDMGLGMRDLRFEKSDSGHGIQDLRYGNHKAQTEIIGLVIVMVLVVMGIMFAMLFVFGREDKSISQEFKEADLPQSTLDAILKTSSFQCTGRTIDQAISDCRTASGIIKCGNKEICVAVKEDVETILKETLGAWEYPYWMSFNTQGITDIQSQNFACPEYRTGSQKRNVAGTTFEIFLRVCNE